MKAFFDTTVLVAAFKEDHVHHEPSLSTFVSFDKRQASCSVHSLAEVYSTLTRIPGQHISGTDALRFIETLEQRLTLTPLDVSDYRAALERAAAADMSGGIIYDALLIQSAIKARAEIIYTWNTSHFRRLGPEVAKRIKMPTLS